MELQQLSQLRVKIHDDFHVKYTNDFITVGDFSYGLPNIQAWNNETKLKIGKFCSIADNVTFMLGGEHKTDWATTYPFNALMSCFSHIKGHPATKGDIIIGNDVWIAQGARIMSGVTVGDGAVIGAGAVVTKNVPPYSIVGGVPAKIIKYRFNKKQIKIFLQMQWWNWEDEHLIQAIELLQSNNIEGLTDFYNTYIK